MLTAHITTPGGDRMTVECNDGLSLMSAACRASVPGIDADCGGSMVCGTCHVHVAEQWLALLSKPSEMETTILDCVPEPHPNARLSCQILMTRALDGIEVTVPPDQR